MASETWLPWAINYPGDPEKVGYTSAPSRTLAQIEGEVKHSAEGGIDALLGELFAPGRRASWSFSVAKDGKVYQHYPLEDIAWTSGSYEANRRYVGIEHEGVTGEIVEGAQYEATLHLSRDLRALCPLIAANPPTRKVNLWEHRECIEVYGGGATSCPGGRIPWDRLIADLLGGDDMTADELKTAIREVLEEYKPAIRQLCAEAIDSFVGPDLGVAPERAIARSVELGAIAAPKQKGTWETNA